MIRIPMPHDLTLSTHDVLNLSMEAKKHLHFSLFYDRKFKYLKYFFVEDKHRLSLIDYQYHDCWGAGNAKKYVPRTTAAMI